MHGTYFFLIDVGENTLKPKKGNDAGRIVGAALRAFDEYMDHHSDANNWCAPLALVTYGNQVVDLDQDRATGRGRPSHGATIKKAAKQAKMKAFEFAHRCALDCVVTDMGVFDLQRLALGDPTNAQKKEQRRLDKLPFDGLVAETILSGAKILADYYAALANGTGAMPLGTDGTEHTWRRRSLSRSYEMFMDCVNTVPFTEHLATPYEYRAYNLSQEPSITHQSAILLVDIHT